MEVEWKLNAWRAWVRGRYTDGSQQEQKSARIKLSTKKEC